MSLGHGSALDNKQGYKKCAVSILLSVDAIGALVGCTGQSDCTCEIRLQVIRGINIFNKARTRVRPFRLKNLFLLISEIKRIWIRFTCVSLFHYKISLLFFCFFSLIFASEFFAPLHFSNFRFEAKEREAKFKSIFSLFWLFFTFFGFFWLFLLNFYFTSFFLLIFCLFYLRFRFRFLVFRIKVNHVKSGFFSLPSETKFLLQFKISLPKRK
jgi:hypothetical protein